MMLFEKPRHAIWVRAASTAVTLCLCYIVFFSLSNLSSKGPMNSYLPWNYNAKDLSSVYFGIGAMAMIILVLLVGHAIQNISFIKTGIPLRLEVSMAQFALIFLTLTYFSMSSGILDTNTDLRQPAYIGYISIQKSFFFNAYFSSAAFLLISAIISPIIYIWRRVNL